MEDLRFKRGDIVKCTGMPESYSDKLIIGKLYTIGRTYQNMTNEFWLGVMENNLVNDYKFEYFEMICPRSKLWEVLELTLIHGNKE